MKRFHIVPYLFLSLLVCLIFGSVLFIYVPPMQDISLDLSLHVLEDVMFLDPKDYDDKGWTVYTQDGDSRTDLTPDGFGGYTGLALGQTFYFSRVMEEELDNPTLQIIPLESTYAVWLDDALLYTDNQGLDLRIGHLTLPMNEWLREEAITVTLPPDYAGKTLTIAQSFPEYSETGSVRAYPTAVRLYCGYAYESALISESFRVAFLALALFLAGVLLSAGAVYLRDNSMLCLALTAFLSMTRMLIGTSFFWNYYGTTDNSPLYSITGYATAILFVFLLLRAPKRNPIPVILTVLYSILIIANSIILTVTAVFTTDHFLYTFLFHILPPWLALAFTILLLVMSGIHWRRTNRFYRLFFLTACSLIPVILGGYALKAGSETVRMQLLSIIHGRVDYLSSLILIAVGTAAMISAFADTASTVLHRRAEAAAMEEHRDMLVSSYENMRRQNEEVMRLRHDMVSHYETLRGIVGDGTAGAYLDDLIGKNKKIRSVVQTGNHMLDIILNNKLSTAADLGIHCEIVRASAPEHLPLSDADICSLVMNILNNAITAANTSSVSEPFIRMDIHVKNDFFALTCENSKAADPVPAQILKEETVPRHGLGMKIVRSIVEQHDGLMEIAAEERQYTIRIAIPLFQAEISR